MTGTLGGFGVALDISHKAWNQRHGMSTSWNKVIHALLSTNVHAVKACRMLRAVRHNQNFNPHYIPGQSTTHHITIV